MRKPASFNTENPTNCICHGKRRNAVISRKEAFPFALLEGKQVLNKQLALVISLLLLQIPALFAQCPITVNAGEDKYVCQPLSPVQLDGSINGPFLSYQWTPTTRLSPSTSLTPTATVLTTTTYTLTAKAVEGTNLIPNGDFESGNSGFSSDYNYSPGNLWPEGTYDVTSNPQASHANFQPCSDHTLSGDQMMVINGAGTPGVDAWCSSAPVDPNTEYVFSVWACSVLGSSPAILQFSINGVLIGASFSLPSTPCSWVRFYATWNSGASGNAVICLVNQNTTLSGNDFAIDDIFFSPVCKEMDEVTVHLVNLKALAAPSTYIQPCVNAKIAISGAGSSEGDNITYLWTTTNGHIVNGATTLDPEVDRPGVYTLTVTFADGNVTCTKTATVVVNLSPNPPTAAIPLPDELSCITKQVELTVGTSLAPPYAYHWNTTNGNILGSNDQQECIATAAGQYFVTVTSTNSGCTATANILVFSNTAPPLARAAGGLISCQNATAVLSGTGSSVGTNYSYLWTTTNGAFSAPPGNLNSAANKAGTYTLLVTNKDNGCTATATTVVTTNFTAPVVNLSNTGQIDCATPTIPLSAVATPTTATFTWVATNGGMIQSGQGTATIIANAGGTYSVIATHPLSGCRDTAVVAVTANTTVPALQIAPPGTLDCAHQQVVIAATGPTTGTGYTYAWNTNGGHIFAGANTLSPTVDAAGTYTLLITNPANHCTATGTVQVQGDTTPVNALIGAPGVLTCIQPTLVLSSTGSSTGPTISRSWLNAAGANLGNGATLTLNTPGTYRLVLVNTVNACRDTAQVLVLKDTVPPVLSLAPPGQLNCAVKSIVLAAQNTAPGNFTYNWTANPSGGITAGQGTLTPTVNSAGTFSLIALNTVNGCRDTVATTLTIDTLTPVVRLAPTALIDCDHPFQIISGTGSSSGPNLMYTWSTSNGGHIAAGQSTPSAKVDAAGTYTLLITNTVNHCTASANAQVQADTNAVQALINVPGPLSCAQPTLVLSSNGSSSGANITSSWLNAAGSVIGSGTTLPLSAPGNYRLLLLNTANACRDTAYATVVRDTVPPKLSLATPLPLNCAVKTMTLNAQNAATGNFSYNWTANPSGSIAGGQGTLTPTVNSAGTFVLVATNTVNGCRDTIATTLTADTETPSVQLAPTAVIDCRQRTQVVSGITFTAGPNPLYVWSVANGGHIVNGQDSPSISVDAAGTYTLLVTNPLNHCFAAASLVVGIDTVTTKILAQPANALTCKEATTSLDAVGTLAPGGVTYAWTNAAGAVLGTSASINVSTPGVYGLSVQNVVNGCTTTTTAVVLEEKTPPAIVILPPVTLDCALKENKLVVQALTAGSNFTYAWNTLDGVLAADANTATPLVTAPGQYGVTATDPANGCTTAATTLVRRDETPPNAQIAPPDTLTCAVGQVEINASASSPSPGFDYAWTSVDGQLSGGANTLLPTVNKPGTYQLVVTNTQNHCTTSGTVIVLEDKTRATVQAGVTDTLTCKVLSLVLSGSSSGTGSNFTYGWSSPNGAIFSGQSTLTPTVTKPGTYILSVTKRSNGCVASDTVLISENKIPPVVSIAKPDTLTCAVIAVTLQATANGQSPDLSLRWDDAAGPLNAGQSTLTQTVAKAGTYFLNVIDPINGCVANDTILVLENKVRPSVSIAVADTITCAKPAITLHATAAGQSQALQILWTTTGGRLVSGQNTLMPEVDRPGTYHVLITEPKNGCINEATIEVKQNALFPFVNAGPSPTLTCAQPEILLQGAIEQGPNIQAVWSTSGGNILGNVNTPTPKVNAPGTYTLSVTNRSTGCTATSSVVVLEDKVKPIANAGLNDTLKCSLAFLRLTGSASGPASDFDYQWTTSNGHFTSDPKQLQPTVDAPGIYLLTVQNRVNGCTETSRVEILRDQKAPLADAGKPANLTCAIREITLHGMASPGAGISQLWQTPDGKIISGQTTLDPLVAAAGVYQLSVLDATNGCKTLSSVRIGEDTLPPVIHAGMTQTLTCARTSLALQGSATAAGNPLLLYDWTSPNGHILLGANTLTPTIDRPGTYVFKVQNQQNGCTSTHQVQVNIDTLAPGIATALPSELTCAVGQIQLAATVAQPASGIYKVQWTNLPGAHLVSGDTSLTPTVDKAGSYRLLVQNKVNGCVSTAVVTVGEDKKPPLANAGLPVELTCKAPTVALDGSKSSQGANFSYVWTGGQIISGGTTLSPLIGVPGTYTLNVRNQLNGCTTTTTVTAVDNKLPPIATIAKPGLLTCAHDTVVLNAKGSGAAPGFTSNWITANGHFLTGANTLSLAVDGPGLYVLTVQNTQNGCTATTTTTVLEDKVAPGAKTGLPTPLSCIAANTTLQGSSPAAYPVTYAWTAPAGASFLSGANTTSPKVSQPGTYQLLVTNPANGCHSTATATVVRLKPPSFQPIVQQPDCHLTAGVVEFRPIEGDAPPFRYALNGSNFLNKSIFEGLPPGSYALQMRDAIGCESTQTIAIKTPFVPTLSIPAVDLLEFGDSVQLQPLANLPSSSIAKWVWSPAEGLSCSDCPRPFARPFTNTRYGLTIFDLNGCTANAAVQLRVSRDRRVWAPNIFSPNGDGKNDFFTIYGKGVQDIHYLRIFDRWGNQVFLAEDIPINEDSAGWDGTFRGQTLVPGVFAWVAEVLYIDGSREVLSGDVTVWR